MAFAFAILYLSTRPAQDLPSTGVAGGDKYLHAVEYFLFGLLLFLPVRGLAWRWRAATLALGIAFAAFDEAVQTTVPGRFGDPADWSLDVLGLVLALLVHTAVRPAALKPATV